jgi:hypothetical protein
MNFVHEIIIYDQQVPQLALTKRFELRKDKLYVYLNEHYESYNAYLE